MGRSVRQRIGRSLSVLTGKHSGQIIARRPTDSVGGAGIVHFGDIGSFLSDESYQTGIWVIAVERHDSTEYHLFKWLEAMEEWQYLGDAKPGVL